MSPLIVRAAAAVLLAVGALAACAERPAPGPAALVKSEPADAATAMNRAVREHYSDTRQHLHAELDVILFVSSGRMVLRQKGEPDWVRSFAPPVVDHYKVASHVPLGLYVMALPYADGPPSEELRREAIEYRERTRAFAAILDQLDIPPSQLPRQQLMIDASLEMLDRLIAQGTVPRRDLEAFARRMGPPQMVNADIAAAITLDTLQAVTAEMRARLKPGQWERLYVLVLGGKMPRAGNLQYEYFVRVMGRNEIERRLLYTESLTTPDTASALLGTVLIDRTIGQAFFGDRYRMDRDLLADGARKHLDRMFGKAR